MIFFYEEPAWSDTTSGFAHHDDAAEGQAVFDVLAAAKRSILLLAMAPEATVVAKGFAVRPLHEVVSGFLFEWADLVPRINPQVFDALPLNILRAAVEHGAAVFQQESDQPWLMGNQRERALAQAQALRDALFLREQRERIAADLAEMERIAAMKVED